MIPQDKFNEDRWIFHLSIFLAAYFLFIFLNGKFLFIQLDALDLVQELCTLPLMFLNCFLLVYLILQSISPSIRSQEYRFKSITILFITNALTWGSIITRAYSHILSTSIAGLFLSIIPVLFIAISGIFLLILFFKKYLNSF